MRTLIDLKTNVVYDHLDLATKRFIVEQGGTRSGKTYNILIWIIFNYCLRNKKKIVTICRKHGPSLRGSSMRDFFTLLQENNLYSEALHSKSTNEYRLNGNLVEFVSLDEPQKIRGRKRDLLFLNEGNELTYEDFFQLNIRTTDRIIIDYNPSDEYHWLYEQVIPRSDCEFFITTYKDNPFLDQNLIDEIERLKDLDDNYWKVYGLGQRGSNVAQVFQFDTIQKVPENARFLSYGLDWGYSNDPTACVKVWLLDDTIYIEEIMYMTGCTNVEIVNILKSKGVDPRDRIFADSAEPKSIQEVHRMGLNVHPSAKGNDSVNISIDLLKRYRLVWTNSSINGIKEMRNYKWMQDKDGRMQNRPVDAFNHAIDALRYAVFNVLSRPNFGKYSVS